MKKIKISCVSYLNSKPFIYGLKKSDIHNEIELDLDSPSACAKKLEENQVDIGLVPSVVLAGRKDYQIISDFCIGADGEVRSVLLLSEVPLNEITTILLDHQSRTSVMLVRILAEKFWKIKPQWKAAFENFENQIKGSVAGMLIGDRTFMLKNKFKHGYDLPAEWKKFTQLPFVFACWVANKELPVDFIKRFNAALLIGVENRQEVIRENKDLYNSFDIQDYLENKISFIFDDKKKKSLKLFLGYVNELEKSAKLNAV